MREPLLLLSIAICGGAGALLRYSISVWVHNVWDTSFPLGTFLANMLGCSLLGALLQATELSPAISPTVRVALGVGLLGALTTFSTFSAETLDRMSTGNWTVACANIFANVVVGLLAVWFGATIVRTLMG